MPSTQVIARDKQICERFLAENITASKLGLDYGLSEVRVRQILKAGNANAKDRAPDVASQEGVEKTLSPVHVKIGRQVAIHRMSGLGMDRSGLAVLLNWSTIKVAAVERGEFNLTLLDLITLEEKLSLAIQISMADGKMVANVDQK